MRAIERRAAVADVIELRMDLIHNGRLVELIGHARDCDETAAVLVTHRPATGSDFRMERRRIEGLKEAVGLGADYVDVELQTDPALREDLVASVARLGRRTALIVSHHDDKRTPSLRTLKALFQRCVQAGADIVKIVTWAESPQDNLRVLSLIADAEREDIDLINFCMGPRGRISRVASPLLGACMSYVSLSRGCRSAPGQLTFAEMNTVMSILRRDA
jgi:3-dehydroquinate dehydratase type I